MKTYAILAMSTWATTTSESTTVSATTCAASKHNNAAINSAPCWFVYYRKTSAGVLVFDMRGGSKHLKRVGGKGKNGTEGKVIRVKHTHNHYLQNKKKRGARSFVHSKQRKKKR